jgi:hypothetical protein
MTRYEVLSELLERFDQQVYRRILALAERAKKVPGRALVVFECQQLDSSALGERTCVLVGPGCAIESLKCAAGGHIFDLPSQRQYPIGYWVPEDYPDTGWRPGQKEGSQ